MHVILYISDYTGREIELDKNLLSICTRAKRENPKHGITGVLFYHNSNFLQLIEGEINELESLMSILEKDTRHKNISRLVDEGIEERGFSDWNMDAFNLDGHETINRPAVVEFKNLITERVAMDSLVFIEILKTVCVTGNLAAIL